MEQLNENNWEQAFENVINNCDSKAIELEKLACYPEEMIEDYKKYSIDAKKKKKEYQTKSFNESKKSIGEDLSFFQQQCNAYYKPLKQKILKVCRNGIRFFKKNIINVSLGFIGLLMIIIGLSISNQGVKGILYTFGIILILLVIANLMYKFI